MSELRFPLLTVVYDSRAGRQGKQVSPGSRTGHRIISQVEQTTRLRYDHIPDRTVRE